MARLGRPKPQKVVSMTFRLSENEYSDLRRCAIGTGGTMADILRDAIRKTKRRLKEAGEWPDTAERGVDDAEDGDA